MVVSIQCNTTYDAFQQTKFYYNLYKKRIALGQYIFGVDNEQLFLRLCIHEKLQINLNLL